MTVSTLSELAIAVLRKIDAVGLTVHWYHQVDTYQWGDESAFTTDEYRVLSRELSRVVEHHENIPLVPDITLKRQRVENGLLYDETVILYATQGKTRILFVEDATVFDLAAAPPDAVVFDKSDNFLGHTLKEKIVEQHIVGGYAAADGSDFITPPVINVRRDFRPVQYRTWESDWLMQETVSSSYEYGIEHSFFLTEKAKALLAGNAGGS